MKGTELPTGRPVEARVTAEIELVLNAEHIFSLKGWPT